MSLEKIPIGFVENLPGQKEAMKDIRGMSDPFAFSFNILDDRLHTMVVHAVIFTSYTAGPNKELKLCEPSDDPRMNEFIRFCFRNYAKDLKAELSKQWDVIEAQKREILRLDKEIKHKQNEATHGKSQ